MQPDLTIPASCRLRVFLHGPLAVFKRSSDGSWRPVVWGQGRSARMVFRRLLATPGRRLSHGQLTDDLWPESDGDSADASLQVAISLLRSAIGKDLVATWDGGYEIAGQKLVWFDLDAAEALLKTAENEGYTSLAVVPRLEEALSYLERGVYLEEESGTWSHACRTNSEDLLRRCRLWLAESYGAQGKLFQASLQYRALLQLMPPNEKALQRWITLLHSQGETDEALRCYQEVKTLAEAEGFALSEEMKKSIEALTRQTYGALLVSGQRMKTASPHFDEPLHRDVFVSTDSDISGRLATLLTRSSASGMEEVAYFDQQTRLYWQAREETALSAATLYPSIIKHIDNLTIALASSHSPAFRQQLCETISRTVLLAGILLYDMGQYVKARREYQIAFQAANEAGNAVLQAVIWGWMSFTWTYSRCYHEALYCIQYARHLAMLTSDVFVQSWLAAIEAEIQSHLLNRDACARWLRTLDRSIGTPPLPDTAYLFEFNPTLLLGYKGVCLQVFYQKEKPATHSFLREAKEALESALISEAPVKRKLYYLSDLAGVYARQGEVEKACAYVAQSLPTVLQIGYGSKTIHKHLFQVRMLLQPYEDAASVRDLDEQLNILHLSD